MARKKRFAWIRGERDADPKPGKPRTLKEQIRWEETFWQRTFLNMSPETPDGEGLARRAAVVAAITVSVVAAAYLADRWKSEGEGKGGERRRPRWEDLPGKLEIFRQEERAEERFVPGVVLSRSPHPEQRPERERRATLRQAMQTH